MKKVLSLVLCISLLLSFAVIPAQAKKSASGNVTVQKYNSGSMNSVFAENENSLIVFVTGIGQSYSYLFDDKYLEDGAFASGTLHDYENYAPLIAQGDYIRKWNLIDFNIEGVIPELISVVGKLAVSAVTGKYIIKDEDVSGLMKKAVNNNIIDSLGNPPENVITPRYAMPVSEYPGVYENGKFSSEAKKRFYSSIPCEDIAKSSLGENFEDYLYCFNYAAFSYTKRNADEMHEFIETILANNKVGAKKVVLVPMSMGGAMVSMYLAQYPDVADNHVRRVVSIVGCWNGSDIVSDLLNKNFVSNSKELFYGGLFADTINTMANPPYGDVAMLALRLFPQPMLSELVSQILGSIDKDVILNTPSLLSLIPDYMYNDLKVMITSPSVFKDVKAYHEAQSTLKSRFAALEKQGVTFSFISGYGAEYGAFEYPFFKFFASAQTTNSDEIINISSTAPGTSCVAYNEKFEDTDGRELSPDGSLDISTAYYKDSTWYFKGQKHQLDYNTTAISLALQLSLGNIKTVDDCDNLAEDGYIYPQFNDSRDIKKLVKNYLPDFELYVAQTGCSLTDEQQKLYDKVVAMRKSTVNNRKADDALTQQFLDMLYDMGVYTEPELSDKALDEISKILNAANKILYSVFGTKSYYFK